MIVKVFTKHSLKEDTDCEDLIYWEGISSENRWNTVQKLREQFYGKQERVERIIKIRKLDQMPEDALPADEFHHRYRKE